MVSMAAALSAFAVVLAAATVVGCFLLLRSVRRMERQTADVEARVAALVPAPPLPASLAATFGSGPRRLIVVEILNPIELATSQVKAASLLSAVRPAMLTKIVYDQAVRQVVDQLGKQGVQADVQIHAGR